MQFEWDENKRLSNLAKHRIDFIDVRAVFYDPLRKTSVDDRWDYAEVRENTIGTLVNKIIVIVTHTDRNGRVRIISARPANKKERSLYYGNC
jgi:uncharacterized DUF497 family protein